MSLSSHCQKQKVQWSGRQNHSVPKYSRGTNGQNTHPRAADTASGRQILREPGQLRDDEQWVGATERYHAAAQSCDTSRRSVPGLRPSHEQVHL